MQDKIDRCRLRANVLHATEITQRFSSMQHILEEATRRKLKTRVIIMTAYSSTETAQDSFRPHAVDYIVKPLRHGDLINSIKEALQQ